MTVSRSLIPVNGASSRIVRSSTASSGGRANSTFGIVDHHHRINPGIPNLLPLRGMQHQGGKATGPEKMEPGPGTRSREAVEALSVGLLRQRGWVIP